MALTKVTSGGMDGTFPDDSIVNADINSSAAVALSKLATDPSNASNLASGTVPTARLGSGTASSTTILYGDQTYKTAPAPGITEYDTWRLSSGFAGDADPIASNWERNDSSGSACPLGTGMSESSGIFTFPSTGKWLITFKITWDHGGETSTYNQGYVKVTLNNSAYTSVDNATDTGDSSNGRAMAIGQYFFDVTDVANCKAAFACSVQNDNVNTMGDSAYNITAAFFARIGDT